MNQYSLSILYVVNFTFFPPQITYFLFPNPLSFSRVNYAEHTPLLQTLRWFLFRIMAVKIAVKNGILPNKVFDSFFYILL